MASDNAVNRYYCILGRDSRAVEQRELSPETGPLFSERLHTLNYSDFLERVRNLFCGIKRGELYYEHGESCPKSFFYCPLPVSRERRDSVAAVFGECGIYSEGREFRYAHCWIEDYSTLDPRTLLCKLFSSRFCGENEILSILSRDKKQYPRANLRGRDSFDPDYSVEIGDKYGYITAATAEKLCEGRTVIIRLASGGVSFSRSAKELLARIMSMLPGDFRRQIGFVTYLQAEQIRAFRDHSNNVRLIVVDEDVDTGEFEGRDPFDVFFFDIDEPFGIDCGEDFLMWSRIPFDEREKQAELYTKYCGAVKDTKKLLPGMIEFYKEALEFSESCRYSEVVRCDTPVKLNDYYDSFRVCRVVPAARAAFAREIPRMLPDGVKLWDMLLSALRTGDESSRTAARACLSAFYTEPGELIAPIEKCFADERSESAERQRQLDERLISEHERRESELNAELAGLRSERDGLAGKVAELAERIALLERELSERGDVAPVETSAADEVDAADNISEPDKADEPVSASDS